jgi:AraC family ethanolamine operon transcriptional activator
MHQETKKSQLLIYQQKFYDIYQLEESLNLRRSYRLFQLDKGVFEYNLTLIDLDVAQFVYVKSNSAVQAIGEKSKGFVEFACLLKDPPTPYFSHYQEINTKYLFAFDDQREANSLIPAGVEIAVVRIQKNSLMDCLEAMDRPDINEYFLRQNQIILPYTLTPVQNYLRQLFGLVKTQSPILTMPKLHRLVLEDFLPLLISAIVTSTVQKTNLSFRSQLVHEGREYMMNHLGRPITLKDLCQALHAGSRTISYGFQEILGISPMAYLKILRLHSVRHVLKKADPETTKIIDVAHQYGFWSAGHFTRDYKMLFGELPSVTLKNKSSL